MYDDSLGARVDMQLGPVGNLVGGENVWTHLVLSSRGEICRLGC